MQMTDGEDQPTEGGGDAPTDEPKSEPTEEQPAQPAEGGRFRRKNRLKSVYFFYFFIF
tara:strand:- start:6870 stop:7043 length:174 start_codon:yes stop_codon:yes gene_type:complete